ncbi:hypothetical protein [Arthrobacter sp. PAMC25284]|uniref:hypothetical protein n=1 Tax=Arthrobacter sp. PAMC25284 TaxID=2861279 RepID=UPI001C62C2B7|nr:hypothetical protein [Arthrobacter sp. PAMC25284]QYF89580.1 hypothetical protein KY499_16165 [Arthrobacter sp. PAMC25284]
MTKRIATILALLMLLLTAACSGPAGAGASSQAASQPASTVTALPDTLPAPDADEQKALLAELSGINLEFTDGKTVEDARRVCGSLLGGVPLDRLLVTVTDLFSSGRETPVADDEEARRILLVIGANGFCR